MVTETITQEDVDPDYMNFNQWNKYGISTTSVAFYRHQWNQRPNNDYSNSWLVRNVNLYDENIYPLKRW